MDLFLSLNLENTPRSDIDSAVMVFVLAVERLNRSVRERDSNRMATLSLPVASVSMNVN